jgi:hypothetical protein
LGLSFDECSEEMLYGCLVCIQMPATILMPELVDVKKVYVCEILYKSEVCRLDAPLYPTFTSSNAL